MLVYYPVKRVGDFVISDAKATGRVTIRRREVDDKGYGGLIWNDLYHVDEQKLVNYLNERFTSFGIKNVEYDFED